MRPEPRDLAILAAIVLLGLGVRLYELTGYGIWFDEGYHLQLVRLPTVGAMLEAILSNPPSDPIYALLLRGWTAMFGYGDAAARGLSVLLSSATLPATYWLGRLLAGRAVGLLAALMLAVSPYAVEFGQEAALYALASLATTAALAAGWRMHATGRGGLLYGILGVAAIYSHYVAAAILASFALLLLLPWSGARAVTRRAWLLAHGFIFLSWLPWLGGLVYFWLNSPLPRATRHDPATLAQVAGGLVQFTSGTAALLNGARAIQVAGLLAGALLLLAGVLAGRATERRGPRVICVLFALIYLLPAAVSSMTGLWLFVPHFMLFLLPALFVALAAGLLHLFALRPRRWSRAPAALAGGLLLIWLAAQVGGLVLFYRHPPHGADGLRELAAMLNREALPAERVLVTPPALSATLAQYYSGSIHGLPSDFDLRAVYLSYEPAAWKDASLDRLMVLAAGRDRFWLVYRPELDPGGEFLTEVRRRYEQRLDRHYDYASLYLFVAR